MGRKMNSQPLGTFYRGGKTKIRREWRGLSDTWYDYKCWAKNWAAMVKFLAHPQSIKGFFRYRWMLEYAAAPDFIDRCTEGLRGTQLRMAHTEFDFIVTEITRSLKLLFRGDRNIGGDPKLSEKMIAFDENMMEQLMWGFPNLYGMCTQVFGSFALVALSREGAVRYIDRAEEFGITGDVCTMPKAELGLCIEDDMPLVGKCILHANTTCDSSLMGNGIEDWRYQLPSYTIACAERVVDDLTREYTADEIRGAIRFIEEQTGEKWNWESYFHNMKLYNQETRNYLEILEMNKTAYPQVPDNNYNLYRDLYYTRMLNAPSEAYLEIDRKIRDLMYEGYEKKALPCTEIRHRALVWGVQAEFYTNFSNWLLNCWGIVGITHMLNLTSTEIYADEDTPENREQAIYDLADLYMKMIMRNRTEGGFSLGVDDVWRFCEEYNLDMIVMLEQMACKAVTTWHGIYEEEAAKRGIHVIWIPHALLDPRKADRQSMRDDVNRYMRTVLGEEPFDPSLETIADQNAW